MDFNQQKGVSMTTQSEKTHEVQLSEKTKIKVSRDTVNGKTFGQIRIWTRIGEKAEWIPTKKGVAFDLSHVDDIVRGLGLITLEKEYA